MRHGVTEFFYCFSQCLSGGFSKILPFIQANTAKYNDMFNYIYIGILELVIPLIANVLAIVVGRLVYRRQKSKLKQG